MSMASLSRKKGDIRSPNTPYSIEVLSKKESQVQVHSEKELFDLLGMNYLEPKDRDW